MIVAGADPGLSGAVAFFDTVTGALTVHDMPTHALSRNGKAKRELDMVELARLVDAAGAGHAYIEQVGAMPGQGVSSVFAFGLAYGALRMAFAASFIPTTLVSPAVWKRALGAPAEKDGARARASQLLPQHAGLWTLKKHDGRAEAALLAVYGARKLAAPAAQAA